MSCVEILFVLATSAAAPAIAEVPETPPAIAETPLPPTDAGVLALLRAWERATANWSCVDVEANEFVYDLAFEVETRRALSGSFRADGTYRIDWKPGAIPPGVAGRAGRFRVSAGQSERIERTATEFVREDHATGARESVGLKDASQSPDDAFLNKGWKIIPWAVEADELVPFAGRVRADDLVRRFEILLVARKEDRIQLSLTPRHPSNRHRHAPAHRRQTDGRLGKY